MRKSLTWLMILTMIMVPVISACGEKSENKSNEPIHSSGPSGQPSSAEADKSPITYSINVVDPKFKWTGTPIGDAFTKETGVTMNYVPVIGDVNQKYEIWAASGDYTDILMLTPFHLQRFRNNGNIIPLENLIDQYGPNIKKKLGKYYELLKDKDGHIYSIYGIRQANESPAGAQASFAVQYKVLEEAGYPEIKTLDQLFDIIKAYYDKHPTIDGSKTIPWSGLGLQMIANNSAISAAGKPDHGAYYMDENDNVKLAYTAEFTKEYLKFLNRFHQEGMLDPELFSLNQETGAAKIAQGRVLGGYFPQWLLTNPESTLSATGKTDSLYAKFPLLINQGIEDKSNAMVLPSSSNYWSITDKAKNPERIIQFIDFLFTDEGQKLINWGVEGEHYDVIDGKRVRKQEAIDGPFENPDYNYNQGFGGPVGVFSYGDGAKLDDGDYATTNTRESIKNLLDPKTKEVLAKYNKELWSDFLSEPALIPAFLWQIPRPEYVQDIQYVFDDIQPIVNKEVPRLIMSKSDADFEQTWTSYVQSIEKKGSKELEEAYTKMWQEYTAKFNELN